MTFNPVIERDVQEPSLLDTPHVILKTAMKNETSLHGEFQRVLSFPLFCGANMSPCVDCMGYLDNPNAGISTIWVEPREILILQVKSAADFKRNALSLWQAFLDRVAFISFWAKPALPARAAHARR